MLRISFVGAALLLLSVWGCGSAEQSTPPPTAAAPSSAPPATVVPGNVKPKNTAAAATAPGKKPSAKKTPKAKPLPDVPADQLVEIGTQIPNFEIPPRNEADPNNLFALVAPIGGNSSTLYLDAGESYIGAAAGVVAPALPTGFAAMPEFGYAEDGSPKRIRCTQDGAEMAYVPAGVFLRGGTAADASPVHPVDVGAFYIDVYEVTLGRYRQFQVSAPKPAPQRAGNDTAADVMPALGVLYRDADAYCAWAGKSLPTEAEWEKAARGPDGGLYPWGNGRVIWSAPRTVDQIDPVGSFPADRSVYGVMDMAGNALEWCSDFYAADGYQATARADGSVVANPTGPRRGDDAGFRVVRGGAADWQTWHRGSASMSRPGANVGFRCVLRLADAGSSQPETASGDPPATVRPGVSRPGAQPDAPREPSRSRPDF